MQELKAILSRREGHARFWERREVKFLRATRRILPSHYGPANNRRRRIFAVPMCRDRLFTFARLPESQWKSARTTNAIERLHEEFKRRIKTQTVLPSAETRRCCSGRCLPQGKSPCAKSMVGRPFPRSSSLNALTWPPDPITSCIGDVAKPNLHTNRDGTRCCRTANGEGNALWTSKNSTYWSESKYPIKCGWRSSRTAALRSTPL